MKQWRVTLAIMRRGVLTWHLLNLIPAALLFVAAGHQLAEQLALRARIAQSGLPISSYPPTMRSEHMGWFLAFLCLGLVFVAFAFRIANLPMGTAHKKPSVP